MGIYLSTYHCLQFVGFKIILVVNDIIMGRASCPLQTGVCLQVKVEIINSSDTPIHNSSRRRISESVRLVFIRGIETGVVPFPHNNNADLWPIFIITALLARCTDQRELLPEHSLELAW